MYDLYNNLKDAMAVTAHGIAADYAQATPAIDKAGFEGVLFVANVGVTSLATFARRSIQIYIEDSDDDLTYAAAADADVLGAVAGAAQTGTFALIDALSKDNKTYRGGYIGDKQYVKCNVNCVGTMTTTGTPISVTALLGKAHSNPV